MHSVFADFGELLPLVISCAAPGGTHSLTLPTFNDNIVENTENLSLEVVVGSSTFDATTVTIGVSEVMGIILDNDGKQ